MEEEAQGEVKAEPVKEPVVEVKDAPKEKPVIEAEPVSKDDKWWKQHFKPHADVILTPPFPTLIRT